MEQIEVAEEVDVVVLGGSIAATTTALILSSRNIRVAIIDKGVHPRFALGESLLKPTVLWMRFLAEKYGVPELNVMANVEKISEEISPTSGVKRCFGFVQHDQNKLSMRDQWWSNLVVNYEDEIAEAHLFRQDTDAFMFHSATKQCQISLSGANVESLNISEDQVLLNVGGRAIKGKYLIDCTGANSIVAKQFGLRENPSRYRSRSRSIFTHMINVTPFDDCGAASQPAVNWHEGTLHHLLDNAWIWVIPFDNHRGSVNPVVSVGVTYYGAALPDSGATAEDQWTELLVTYPALNAQFSHAKTVRPWVKTGELQYSSRTSIGKRYCLLGAAFGGIDALFSRGLLNTMQGIHQLAESLLGAIETNDFDSTGFAAVDKLQCQLLEINDLLTYGFYCCKGSSFLTTWWLAAWTLVEQQSNSHADTVLGAYLSSEQNDWPEVSEQLKTGRALANEREVISMLTSAAKCMELHDTNQCSERETRTKLLELSTTVAVLGFNFPVYENFLKKVGFHGQSRALLQLEYGIASVIDDIDKWLNLEGLLRSDTLTMCLVKMISGNAAMAFRESQKSGESGFAMVLRGAELLNRFTAVIDKWVSDLGRRNTLREVALLCESIEYKEHQGHQTENSKQAVDCASISLLVVEEKGHSVTIQFKLLGSKYFELQIESRLNMVHRLFVIRASQSLLNMPNSDASDYLESERSSVANRLRNAFLCCRSASTPK